MNEIIESEAKYSEDLKLINSIFIEPLAGTDIISDADAKELFININDISPIHEKICFEISRPYPKAEDKISKLINCYLDNVSSFILPCTSLFMYHFSWTNFSYIKSIAEANISNVKYTRDCLRKICHLPNSFKNVSSIPSCTNLAY